MYYGSVKSADKNKVADARAIYEDLSKRFPGRPKRKSHEQLKKAKNRLKVVFLMPLWPAKALFNTSQVPFNTSWAPFSISEVPFSTSKILFNTSQAPFSISEVFFDTLPVQKGTSVIVFCMK